MDAYYEGHKSRYRRTLEYYAKLPFPRPARTLEIGGGQIVLMAKRLFGDEGTLGDVSEEFAGGIKSHGILFTECDLLHDDIPFRDHFDCVVMGEVVEHLPVPLHGIMAKVLTWLKPGGFILLTTPNLYRLRNLVRLALGARVFDFNFHPDRGKSIGHPFEYYEEHLRWHLEQAGYTEVHTELAQLAGYSSGATAMTKAARLAAAPLFMRRIWRDSIVATARRPLS